MSLRGTVAAIWRYPVKSMLGEALAQTEVGPRGVAGDRAFGVLDLTRGSVLSAKREPSLFGCSARYVDGALEIRLPDGTVTGEGETANRALTSLIGRPVELVPATSIPAAVLQGEIEEGGPSEWRAPAGTFFDASPLHLLTLSTLRRFAELYPEGDFDPRRFRPNVVIDAGDGAGFVEEDAIGRDLQIGALVASVTKPCGRCVMTTHEQSGLARDPGILRTIARTNANNLGVRAVVT